MGEMGAFVLTESAAKLMVAFAAIMREMDILVEARSASRAATARSSFRTLRAQRPPIRGLRSTQARPFAHESSSKIDILL